ncbi:hypothetical protein OG906_38345 (plasmid) [Streptomyces sp. NBC_01426]|nr:hypothetical protein [Streptomyces sp. NBC_01426]
MRLREAIDGAAADGLPGKQWEFERIVLLVVAELPGQEHPPPGHDHPHT